MPDYVVIRDPANPSIDGKWYDLEKLYDFSPLVEASGESYHYHPTGEFEVRDDDGAVAQVWRRKDE